MPVPVLPACLAWLAWLGGVLVLALADPFPLRLTLLAPAGLHGFLVAAEVAFAVIAWPAFARDARGGLRGHAGRAALLLVLALPLVLVAENVSAAGPVALLRGQALVFALALLASSLRGGEPGRSPAYVLGAGVACAVLPAAAFVSGEFGGADLSWLAAFSPLWAAVELGGWRDLACSSLAVAAGGVLAAREASR